MYLSYSFTINKSITINKIITRRIIVVTIIIATITGAMATATETARLLLLLELLPEICL